MLLMTIPSDRLTDLIVSDEILERIERILNEFRNRNKLQKYGLMNRRKILIEGRPGTGKTFTNQLFKRNASFQLRKEAFRLVTGIRSKCITIKKPTTRFNLVVGCFWWR